MDLDRAPSQFVGKVVLRRKYLPSSSLENDIVRTTLFVLRKYILDGPLKGTRYRETFPSGSKRSVKFFPKDIESLDQDVKFRAYDPIIDLDTYEMSLDFFSGIKPEDLGVLLDIKTSKTPTPQQIRNAYDHSQALTSLIQGRVKPEDVATLIHTAYKVPGEERSHLVHGLDFSQILALIPNDFLQLFQLHQGESVGNPLDS
ncbi:MAG: hypothetical protein JSW08_01670 [archaeon]|nr:MAG: hypothetical protein JSW08_01670 [archaeon]